MMEAMVSEAILQNVIYKRKKGLLQPTHGRRKPIYQAVSASLPTGDSVGAAYLHCIKDGTNIDPCMGSGHILVYAFDIFMEAYRSNGYSDKNAAKLIIEKNLYGLDIDKRAYQLSYFASMMKARQYNRNILKENIKCNILDIREGSNISSELISFISSKKDEKIKEELLKLQSTFNNAKEYGSLIDTSEIGLELLEEKAKVILSEKYDDLLYIEYQKQINTKLMPIIKVGKILANKYDVVITNPPYLGGSMSGKLSEFLKKNYKDSKSDLFAAFIEKCEDLTKKDRYYSMVTMHSWMFLSSFEKLRNKMSNTRTINMIHLGTRAFDAIGGEVVQTTTWVEKKQKLNDYKSAYIRLVDYPGESEKEQKTIEAIENKDCGYYYETSEENFEKIPGSPIAYWAQKKIYELYKTNNIFSDVVTIRKGLATGNVPLFIKYWYEVYHYKIIFKKWIPCHKGGSFRKWRGNLDRVINWENDGFQIKNYRDEQGNLRSRPQNLQFMKKGGIVFSKVTSGGASSRLMLDDEYFDDAVQGIFTKSEIKEEIIMSLLNSKVTGILLSYLNPTLNKQVNDLERIVVAVDNEEIIYNNSSVNIELTQKDWDSFETSWDFTTSPLLKPYNDNKVGQLSFQYEKYKNVTNNMFANLKENEEELNRIFIENYGLEEELTPDVSDKDITIAKIFETKEEKNKDMKDNIYALTREDVIKNFISYGVGCIFGRYSLDKEGLIFAGNIDGSVKLPDEYERFIPDMDGILPITDSKYFKDDIVTSFERFVEAALGKENLEENLEFISKSLKNDNRDSIEVIREYFIKDFYKDHVKMYKKRPIYWLYDSGRENGFKALVYMHRYEDQTTARVRTGYLHELQKHYNSLKDSLVFESEHGVSAYDKKVAFDRIKKLERQINECKSYDELIGHIANEKIKIDLDDGVKVNYQKVQTGRDGKVLQILGKI